MKTKLCLVILLIVGLSTYLSANPVNGLLERIDKGASKKFVIELNKGADDFFELDQKGSKVVVRGNNYVNIATGINWYLKYYAGIQLSWNGMQASLPAVLPPVTQKERHETSLSLRYDFNYCTYSYTMAFWGLGALGERNRLDGPAWHQSSFGRRRAGVYLVQYAPKTGIFQRRNKQLYSRPAFLGLVGHE